MSLIAACGGDDGKGGSKGDASTAGPDGSAGPDASRPDGGPSNDAASDAAPGKDAAMVGTAPSLTTVTAAQVGLSGSDLRIDFTASDMDQDISSVMFTVWDSANVQIGEDHELPIAAPIKYANHAGSSYVILTDGLSMDSLSGHTDFKTAKVTISDANGNDSAEMDVTITVQPEVAMGGACDPTFLMNRCASGLGCKGMTTKTCLAGEPPTLSTVGYFNDALGARILFAGTDPDGDAKTYTLHYLDASGADLPFDEDNDPSTPAVTSFTAPLPSTMGKTDFFVHLSPSDALIAAVPRIGVTVTDSRASNNTSAQVNSAAVASAPLKSAGATCDPRGFDFCNGTTDKPLVCATTGTSSKCTLVATARTAACNAANVVQVTGSGTFTVQGGTANVSLWDQPVGCSNSPANEPDSVVKLTLSAPVTTLILSTDNAYTSFDTTLYAIRNCADAPTLYDPRTPSAMTDFWCNDNQQAANGDITNVKSVLTLNNLAAGSYFVIVDTAPSAMLNDDLFELDVTAM